MKFGKWIDFNAMPLTDRKGLDDDSQDSMPASPHGLPGGQFTFNYSGLWPDGSFR